MNKIVRSGSIEDQDRFRRDDVSRLAPDDRVGMVFGMRASVLGTECEPLARVASIRRLGGRPCASSSAVEGPA